MLWMTNDTTIHSFWMTMLFFEHTFVAIVIVWYIVGKITDWCDKEEKRQIEYDNLKHEVKRMEDVPWNLKSKIDDIFLRLSTLETSRDDIWVHIDALEKPKTKRFTPR